MTQPRISYNVHSDAPNFDRAYLESILDAQRPMWVLIMNAPKLAIELANKYPQTNVITRMFAPADDDPLKSWGTWQNFLNAAKNALAGTGYAIPENLWVYVNNESGDSDQLHAFLSGLISQPELRFVVGNYSVGTPQDVGRWHQLRDFLRLVSDNRHRVILGLHEYFGVLPTSGFIGGAPNNPLHPDYTIRANWPEDASNLTKWHCGRLDFILAACSKYGIKPPRIVLTEHGADNLTDIAEWAQALPKTPPYEVNRGWRSLWNAWRSLYGSDLDVERFYADCLIYLDKAVYSRYNGIVEAQLIYSLFGSNQWHQFDIAYTGIPRMLVEYAGTTPPPVEPPDEPMPEPETKAQLLAMVVDAMEDLGIARNQLANVIEILNRLEETIQEEL